MAVGDLNGVNSVVAPSLGQEEYALNAGNGSMLPGWPFFTADSGFTTPSLADLYGNGQTEVIEGGDSSPGLAYGQTYTAGGHLRVLGAGGNLICDYNTNQTVDSSTGGRQLPRRRADRHRLRHRVVLPGRVRLQHAVRRERQLRHRVEGQPRRHHHR